MGAKAESQSWHPSRTLASLPYEKRGAQAWDFPCGCGVLWETFFSGCHGACFILGPEGHCVEAWGIMLSSQGQERFGNRQ